MDEHSVNALRVGQKGHFQTIAVYASGILTDKKAVGRGSAAVMVNNCTTVRVTNRTPMRPIDTWIHVCAVTIAMKYIEASVTIARTNPENLSRPLLRYEYQMMMRNADRSECFHNQQCSESHSAAGMNGRGTSTYQKRFLANAEPC